MTVMTTHVPMSPSIVPGDKCDNHAGRFRDCESGRGDPEAVGRGGAFRKGSDEAEPSNAEQPTRVVPNTAVQLLLHHA